MSFKRKYAPQWADVASLIDQMEQLLTRHKVPLAVVDGGQLAMLGEAPERAVV